MDDCTVLDEFPDSGYALIPLQRDACRKAWDWFEASPDNIASIMRRKWVTEP